MHNKLLTETIPAIVFIAAMVIILATLFMAPPQPAQAGAPNQTYRNVIAEANTGPVSVSIAPAMESFIYRASISFDSAVAGGNTYPITVSLDSGQGADYDAVILSEVPQNVSFWSYTWAVPWYLEADDAVSLEFENSEGAMAGAQLVIGNMVHP